MKLIHEFRIWLADRAEERRIGYPAGMISGPNPIRARWISFILSRKMKTVTRDDMLGDILRKLI
jgi:hypothetical protein